MENKENEYWHDYSEVHKNITQGIHDLVKRYGWKDFVFALLKYQKMKIDSAYKLLQSWK